MYTGSAVHNPNLPDVGVSGNILLWLTGIIPRHALHKIYFDIWFTSVQLQVEQNNLECSA
jgi:hypothetical protein